jgi:RHS repeat-associated protein
MARCRFGVYLSSPTRSNRNPVLFSLGARQLPVNVRQFLLRFVSGLVFCFIAQFSWAQSITGLAPFAPFAGGGAETVNLANLNVHLAIPVVHKVGRGLDFNYVLNYDSTIWTPAPHTLQWTPVPNWGWRSVSESSVGYMPYFYYYNPQGWPSGTNLYALSEYSDPNGTSHPMRPLTTTYLCWPYEGINCQTSGQWSAMDGSGYTLSANVNNNILSISIVDRSGDVILPPLINITNGLPTSTNGPGSITDPNGNQISTTGSSFTDTLGMNVLTVTGTNPVVYTYTGPNQTPESVKVNFSSYLVATNFGCAIDPEYPPTQVNLVSSILLADGTSYTFQYEQNGSYYTGRIAQLGLPTGGYIKYQYTGANNGIMCNLGTASGLTRTLSDGSPWQYGVVAVSGTPVTITDPAQNQTVLATSNGAAVKAQTYQGSASSGILLQTVTTCYNAQAAACTAPTGPPSNGTPGAITTITLPAGGKSSQVTSYLNSNTLPTEIDTYDFGVSSPTQKELISYQSIANISNRKNCDQVLVGTSVPSSCGTATSNTKSLTTATYDSLGNLQSTASWVSGVSSPQYLNRSFQYFSNGLLKTSTDVNNNPTTYGYQSCNFTPAYLSSVSSGGLTTSTTWDCNGGVVTQSKDANQQPTNFGYTTQGGTADPFWRVLSVTDPLGYTTWNTYTTAPSAKETSLTFNNNASGSDVLVTLDGLGRPSVSQVRAAPGSGVFDNTVTYGYGWGSTGQVLTQTIPGGAALTTTQLDALGRAGSTTDGGGGVVSTIYSQNDVLRGVSPPPAGENSKQRQIEYDAFRRITSVCEVTSTLAGNGKCNQASSTPNGYFTQYVYDNPVNSLIVTQNATGAAQTRSFYYDGLGRMVSETNPEWGSGTAYYTYDTDATCGTSKGDLVKKLDAAGNVTCLTHDALHRVTGMTYPSGPYSAGTPNKTFIYDATTFSCTNPNVKGRLAEAFTGPSSAKITDIAYCYSARGENTDVFESTPNSNSYYHTTASYWANGALNLLGGVPQRNSWTFGVDGEGRPYSAVDGTTTNLVTATTYNGASQPTGVSLGSGDSDAYTYDPNTGRMATYQYKIGSTPKVVTGTLGWNSNWSLGSLVVSDPFNSANAQACGYAHDDLARLQSVSCGPTSPNGATWSQSFSYDPFGNISKSGTSSFLPTYAGTSNQFYQLPGGPAGTSHYYDADGNLISDLTNTYAWDSDGNLVGINLTGGAPISITYDALDRAVEQNNSGVFRQVLYSPIGKLALTTKQVANNVFLPLPGGEQATYTGSTIRFRHYDWLGSARLESSIGQAMYGDVAYAPFGETYSIKSTPYLSFTGQDSDTLAGLYDFVDREYSPVQGRWLSSHSTGIAAVDFANPQSWNGYGYVTNSPNNTIDVSTDAVQRTATSPLKSCKSAGGTPAEIADCLRGAHKQLQKIMNKDYTPRFPTLSGFTGLQALVEPLDFRQAGQLVDDRGTDILDVPSLDMTINVRTSCFFDTAGGTRSACSGFYTGFGWGDFWQWANIDRPITSSNGFGFIQGMGGFNFGDPSIFGNPQFSFLSGDDSNSGSGSGGGSGGPYTPIPPDCVLCSVQ